MGKGPEQGKGKKRFQQRIMELNLNNDKEGSLTFHMGTIIK